MMSSSRSATDNLPRPTTGVSTGVSTVVPMAYPLAKQPLPEDLHLTARQDCWWQCTTRHGALEEHTAGLGIGIHVYHGFLLSHSLLHVHVMRNPPKRGDLDVQQLLGGPMQLLERHPRLAVWRSRTRKSIKISQTE